MKKRQPQKSSPLAYLGAFLRDRNVATVAPSSRFVAKRIVKALGLAGGETVLEYGPADGVLSRPILAALGERGRLVAIERNPDLHAQLCGRVRDARFQAVKGDVRQVRDLIGALGLDGVDRIVSGIPFTFLKPYERGRLLEATRDLLRPGGRFVAYQFTTVLRGALELFFPLVKVEYEVVNLPPLFVFTCRV